ncbi:39S ribosomal protein [Sarcoptes scabiei]|nr:39S ribosomal protein [Sarcoptes scabiei]
MMADPSWLDTNNITSVRLKTSTGTVEIQQLEAFGMFGQTFLVTLYSLTTFFALAGNTLVILVEIYGRRSARNLQKFLINLAISDLLLGVLVAPFVYTDIMLGRWIFYPLLCPVTQFVQMMSVFVTTYTLTFIGIERYFATLHPLSSANTWLRSHGNLVLQLGWLFGSTLASFSIQNTKVVAFKYANQTFYDCANWVNVAEQDMQVYVTLSFVLTFVLPIIFLTISYGAIGRRLMRTQKYWCSYKQTVPFSQNSATKIPSNNQQEQLQESEHNQSGQQKSTINSHSMNDSINNFGPFNYRSIGSINNCQTLIQSKPMKPSSSLSLSSSSSQSASIASKTATYSPSSIVASKSVESCPITYNDSHCYKHNHHHPEENRNQRENFLKEKSFTKLRINRSFYLGRLHRNKSVSNKNPTILFRNYNPKTILAKSIESRSEIKISSANNSINNNSVNLASNDGSFNSIGLSGGVVLGEGGGGSGIGTSRFNRFHSRSKNNHPYTIILKFDKRNTEFLNKMRVFRLLVAVLVLFIICWLPIKIFMLILAFWPSIVYLDSITSYYIYYISFFLCHWLSMANSFANPILYCFLSKSFRADLLDLFIFISAKLNICIKSCDSFNENHRPKSSFKSANHHDNLHLRYQRNHSKNFHQSNRSMTELSFRLDSTKKIYNLEQLKKQRRESNKNAHLAPQQPQLYSTNKTFDEISKTIKIKPGSITNDSIEENHFTEMIKSMMNEIETESKHHHSHHHHHYSEQSKTKFLPERKINYTHYDQHQHNHNLQIVSQSKKPLELKSIKSNNVLQPNESRATTSSASSLRNKQSLLTNEIDQNDHERRSMSSIGNQNPLEDK